MLAPHSQFPSTLLLVASIGTGNVPLGSTLGKSRQAMLLFVDESCQHAFSPVWGLFEDLQRYKPASVRRLACIPDSHICPKSKPKIILQYVIQVPEFPVQIEGMCSIFLLVLDQLLQVSRGVGVPAGAC